MIAARTVMPKKIPDIHTCELCKSLVLSISLDDETETRTLQAWKAFASPQSLASLESNHGLQAYLRSQLKTMNPFLTIKLQDIRTQVENGCLLFAYILEKVEKAAEFLKGGGIYVEHSDNYNFFYGQDFQFDPHYEMGVRSGNDTEERIFLCIEPHPGQQPPSKWRFRWFIEPYRPFHRLHFKAKDDIEGAHIADDGERIDLFQTVVQSFFHENFPRYFNFEPGSDEALARFRRMIETESQHQDNEVDSAFVPSRLVSFDISKPRSHSYVKLVDRSVTRDSTKYAALSYCWGGDQKLKLTRETYARLSQGIEFESLPLTLRDAIIVASKFELPYLWIDALCIMQDDKSDMGRELAVMAQIYENASLTISASRASSVEEGFLQPRRPFKDSATVSFCLQLLTPFSNRLEPTLCFLVAELESFEAPNHKISESGHEGTPRDPLVSRAWCFQERALSKRLIEFGALSTRIRVVHRDMADALSTDGWMSHDHHHMVYFGPHSIARTFDDYKTEAPQRRGRQPPSHEGYSVMSQESALPHGPLGIKTYWCSTLSYYSQLKLSYLKDRLPGFSAIASSFAVAWGGKENYLAGIWRDMLPLGLLWIAYGENEDKDDVSPERVAPSWSWASVSAYVSYTDDLDHNAVRTDFSVNFLTTNLALDQGLEVLDCKIDLTNKDTVLGAVDRGELRLLGRLLPVYLSLEKSLERNQLHWATRMESARSHSRVAGNYSNERGLHRRHYEHPEPTFRERRLMARVVPDRNEDAFEAMVAEAKGELFALPIASGPCEEREKGEKEALWEIETLDICSIYGILVLRQADGTYIRMGFFKFWNQGAEWLFDDERLDVEQMPEFMEDQYEWMKGGEIEEIVLV
jgi:hypothetical protein